MPNAVTLDDNGYVLSTSNIDGDTLTVHPVVFARMQDVLLIYDGSPDVAAKKALVVAGLTDEEINSRLHRETKIVVDASLAHDVRKTG